jgi:hypothetical protein
LKNKICSLVIQAKHKISIVIAFFPYIFSFVYDPTGKLLGNEQLKCSNLFDSNDCNMYFIEHNGWQTAWCLSNKRWFIMARPEGKRSKIYTATVLYGLEVFSTSNLGN